MLKELVKTDNRVYFLVNRSVQLVARNRECPKELNNVPCVIWSCIKMHATHEIVNYALRLIIHAKGACENRQSCLFFSEL